VRQAGGPWADNRCMSAEITVRSLLVSLVGEQIETITGRPNKVLRVAGDNVVVATNRSPAGEPVPIAWVQRALERLLKGGD
jgi:hypothetical protein